ncbi:hypothetical protein [Bradyrhizobium sp. WSM2793]|uniref:hypothetical protein n=1 Tax=Bradyrhizobium sp. WSM2793 TaxID=1038866 RepID=UPI0012FCDB84|nr:hypothetical protein [Bradyrhizobium sp. WSM2793]
MNKKKRIERMEPSGMMMQFQIAYQDDSDVMKIGVGQPRTGTSARGPQLKGTNCEG